MKSKFKVLITDVSNNNVMVEGEFEQILLHGTNGSEVEEYRLFNIKNFSEIIELCEHTIEEVSDIIKEDGL